MSRVVTTAAALAAIAIAAVVAIGGLDRIGWKTVRATAEDEAKSSSGPATPERQDTASRTSAPRPETPTDTRALLAEAERRRSAPTSAPERPAVPQDMFKDERDLLARDATTPSAPRGPSIPPQSVVAPRTAPSAPTRIEPVAVPTPEPVRLPEHAVTLPSPAVTPASPPPLEAAAAATPPRPEPVTAAAPPATPVAPVQAPAPVIVEPATEAMPPPPIQSESPRAPAVAIVESPVRLPPLATPARAEPVSTVADPARPAVAAAPVKAQPETVQPPSLRPDPPVPVVVPARAAAPRANCGPPEISTRPEEGGRMTVSIASPCHAGQLVSLTYGGVAIAGRLDSDGRLDQTIELFVGDTSPLEVSIGNSVRREIAVASLDLDRVRKVALIWRAPVDLDMHVFEYGAQLGQAGHVWRGRTPSLIAARELALSNQRARGFISRSDDGSEGNDRLEVYTMFESSEQVRGRIAISVDYASRGNVPAEAHCAGGQLAELSFELVVFNEGKVTREPHRFTAMPCGTPLAATVRYPTLRSISTTR